MSGSHINSKIAICPMCESRVSLANADFIPGFNGRYTHYSCLRRALAKNRIIIPIKKPDWINEPQQAFEFFFTLIQIHDLMFIDKPAAKKVASSVFLKIFKYFGWYSMQNSNVKKALSTYAEFANAKVCACCGMPVAMDNDDIVYGQDGQFLGHYACYRDYLSAIGITLDLESPRLTNSQDWYRYFLANFKYHFAQAKLPSIEFVRMQFLAVNDIFAKLQWDNQEITQLIELYNY